MTLTKPRRALKRSRHCQIASGIVRLPVGKDLTEFYQAGATFGGWFDTGLSCTLRRSRSILRSRCP